jgi:hypothetical protein
MKVVKHGLFCYNINVKFVKESNGPVAQRIEQRFPKPCVGCSTHLGAAMIY